MVSTCPKHIISGLKYLAAVELRKKGHNQEIAEVIKNICPNDKKRY